MGASLGGGSSGRRDSRRYRKNRFTDINVTPMVDVMLVLLIIFMVTAPLLTSGVQVDLPKVEAAALPGNDEPLVVSIQADGKVFLQKEPIDIKDLGTKLTAVSGEKKDTRIFVKGDKAVPYEIVMQVVGAITSADFHHVALLTDQTADTSHHGK